MPIVRIPFQNSPSSCSDPEQAYQTEYLALVGSFCLVALEAFIRVLTLALPISTSVRDASDFVELCRLFGYEAEEHISPTKDGYLLGLHRLAWRKGEEGRAVNAGPNSLKKRVVYLHHGLLMNSEVWVSLTDAERCLPLVLVERGFDVWLGNNRGNKYSKKSVRSSPSSLDFWNFSMDEFALHDIPDSISYILDTTGAESLSYIGFSQGTAQAFATLSIHPKLNTKINVFIALAPAMSPAGLSNGMSVVHWFQIIRNRSFQMYDDDRPGISLSGQNKHTKVARYPTRNIKTPIVLVYGGSDSLVDIRVMLKELPPQTVATEIPHYEHLDFLWGRDIDRQVFPHVFDALDSFTDAAHSQEEYDRYRVVRQESLITATRFQHTRKPSDVTDSEETIVPADDTLHSNHGVAYPQRHRAKERPPKAAPLRDAPRIRTPHGLKGHSEADDFCGQESIDRHQEP
ncbi:unnamed protein product [Parascedosporium putredinis]|uniref:AB hydrolase-1 domain-containing protein n=1 Tax=Parascedosporium putredinis TaxID=1442378 RepID=A0A9P1GV02_9PEZI|nr:unnamed protein product [Parascedosporium putredinis]CAI7987870.1 unnamed protein product [Parascedosporium putredinis]